MGPNPSELVATALASCTSITLKMYADRKGWDLDKIEVKVDVNGDGNFEGKDYVVQNRPYYVAPDDKASKKKN